MKLRQHFRHSFAQHRLLSSHRILKHTQTEHVQNLHEIPIDSSVASAICSSSPCAIVYTTFIRSSVDTIPLFDAWILVVSKRHHQILHPQAQEQSRMTQASASRLRIKSNFSLRKSFRFAALFHDLAELIGDSNDFALSYTVFVALR